MRYVYTQSGAALIILLTIFILGSVTFFLSQMNERTHYMLEDQEQTIRVLTQAKESLLGFAATYAQNHNIKLQGYLPCSDQDGDGSAEPPCEGRGQTVIGRFPWRTLGLPPLRDGSGECLWYAVSGNFKDLPKSPLHSDSNGMIVIRNANNQIVIGRTPSEQAIAVLFAPGRSLKGQENRYNTTNTLTECGSEIDVNQKIIEPINQVRYYLDKYNFDGVVIDNPSANNSIFISPSSGLFVTFPTITNVTPTFINAPPVYETYLHPGESTEQLDRANPTFNDTLIAITPEDFKPIYRMMDYQVATQVRGCLDRYAQKSLYNFMNSLQADIKTSNENSSFIFVDKFLDLTKLPKINATVGERDLEKIRILTTIKKSIAITKRTPYPKYPWPSYVNPYDYIDDENSYFGRIPITILHKSSFETTQSPHLLATRNAIFNLFSSSIQNILSYKDYKKLSDTDWPNLWTEFEKRFTTPGGWPVDPQESFVIFDLHNLEYEDLKNNSLTSIDEIRKKVLDTLANENKMVMVFAEYYKLSTNTIIPKDSTEFDSIKAQVINKINSLNKIDLIDNIIGIKNILETTTDQTISQLRNKYQCFFFIDDPANPDSEPIEGSSKWWWWKGWQDKVFFAIHPNYSLNNNSGGSLIFNTPSEKDSSGNPIDIKAEMLVLVAGRLLNEQQRSQTTQKANITNYLEGQNSDGDNRFIHAPVTSTFNDVVL